MSRILPALMITALMVLPVGTAGQETVRVEVELVNVIATVTDAAGRFVPGLEADDFIIQDNGQIQQISHFTRDDDVPINLGIVLDTSASMLRRIDTALAAIERFVGTLNETDDVFFLTFSDEIHLRQALTNDRKRFSRSLLEARPMGGTALYDALVASLETASGGRHDKRGILLLTDGSDTSSEHRLADALDALARSSVLVYALGIDMTRFGDPSEHVRFELPGGLIPRLPGRATATRAPDSPVDMKVLEEFATASGGQAYRVSPTWTGGTRDDIDLVLDEVSAELRNQYSLGYYPSNRDGRRVHTIEVRVRNHPEYTVRTRSGYRTGG